MENQLTIFALDDDALYLKVLEQKLKALKNYELSLFTESVPFLGYLYQCPKIVILDYHLIDEVSSWNGEAILKHIKNYNSDIKVILLSSLTDETVAIELIEKGAFEFIQKNEKAFDKLITIIQKIQQEQIKYSINT
ncbi:MAG: response regulator [Deltaproteobacteria bacterium]|nr:response regulator [Deltaproteobacteria bacterium]